MSPADAPVRIPVDLLSRATKLNPENRAEMIRVACEMGLAALEAASESTQQQISEVVSAMVDEKLSSMKPSNAPERFVRIPMIPKGAGLPVHFEWKEHQVVQFETPQMNWMIYQIVDLEIYTDNHAIRVSDLRMNGGEGENLLTPEWHTKDDFGHGSGLSSILHQNVVISPNTVVLDVCSTRSQSSPVSVSIVARVLRDDAFGPGPLQETPTSRGALVQVPFRREKDLFVAKSSSVLKIRGIRFRDSVEGLCRIPHLRDLFLSSLAIGGSPNLLPWEVFTSSLDFSTDFFGLRAAPVLIPPNFAQVDLRTASGRAIYDEDLPMLVCEVLEPGNIRKTARELKTHFELFDR